MLECGCARSPAPRLWQHDFWAQDLRFLVHVPQMSRFACFVTSRTPVVPIKSSEPMSPEVLQATLASSGCSRFQALMDLHLHRPASGTRSGVRASNGSGASRAPARKVRSSVSPRACMFALACVCGNLAASGSVVTNQGGGFRQSFAQNFCCDSRGPFCHRCLCCHPPNARRGTLLNLFRLRGYV